MWNSIAISDISATFPIVLISFFGISSMLIDALAKNSGKIVFQYSIFGLIAVAISAIYIFPNPGTAFGGMVTVGGYASYFDVIFALAGIMTMLAAHPYLQRAKFELHEFYTLVTFSIAGMMLMAHANNLLVLFIGIETMSIPFYILSGYMRNQIRSVEAALKYFLLGAFATGFLLYGMTLIYGATGSMDYVMIKKVATIGSNMPQLLLIGIGLMIVGLGFKVAVFPFHQWVPDVYEGAPSVVTGFMSTAGKAAGFSAFMPIMAALIPTGSEKIQMLLAVISAASMLYGNITAISQTNIKRMLAYSSIAHAGYILIGVVANSTAGQSGIMFYTAAYLFMQLGAFTIISILETEFGKNLQISDYIGLSKSHPVLAALMAIFMFSLTGIPPFAGFYGKYYLFSAAIQSGYTWLAIVGVIGSMVSVYFYLGLIVAMYFKKPDENQAVIVAESHSSGITLLLAGVGVFVLGLLPFLVDNLTKFALALPK